jgi:hypothetical protein
VVAKLLLQLAVVGQVNPTCHILRVSAISETLFVPVLSEQQEPESAA